MVDLPEKVRQAKSNFWLFIQDNFN